MPIKGFTLFEMLITLAIMNLMFLSIPKLSKNLLKSQLFVSEYHLNQSRSLLRYEEVYFPNEYSKYPIYFNANGNINMAQSFNVGNINFIIRIANGNITYE